MGTAPLSKPTAPPQRPYKQTSSSSSCFKAALLLKTRSKQQQDTALIRLILLQDWQRVLIRVKLFPHELADYHSVLLYEQEFLVLPLHLVCTLEPPPQVVQLLLELYPGAATKAVHYSAPEAPNKSRRRNLFRRRRRRQKKNKSRATPDDANALEGNSAVFSMEQSMGDGLLMYSPFGSLSLQTPLSMDGAATASSYKPTTDLLEPCALFPDDGEEDVEDEETVYKNVLLQLSPSGSVHSVPIGPGCDSDSRDFVDVGIARGSRMAWDHAPLLTDRHLLPLFLGILYQASPNVIQLLLEAYPAAATTSVMGGMLPIHICSAGWVLAPLAEHSDEHVYPLYDVLKLLVDASSVTTHWRSRNHAMTPYEYLEETMVDGRYKRMCLQLLESSKQTTTLDDLELDNSASLFLGSSDLSSSHSIPGEIRCSKVDSGISSPGRSRYNTAIYLLLVAKDWEGVLAMVEDNPSVACDWQHGMLDDDEAWERLPLHLVCTEPDAPIGLIQVLLLAHADGASAADPNDGSLPLHLACRHAASYPVVKALLEASPDATKAVDNQGRLPLHCALLAGATYTVAEALVEQDPESVFALDGSGKLPLDYATMTYGAESDVVNLIDMVAKFLEKARALGLSSKNGNLPPIPAEIICSKHRDTPDASEVLDLATREVTNPKDDASSEEMPGGAEDSPEVDRWGHFCSVRPPEKNSCARKLVEDAPTKDLDKGAALVDPIHTAPPNYSQKKAPPSLASYSEGDETLPTSIDDSGSSGFSPPDDVRRMGALLDMRASISEEGWSSGDENGSSFSENEVSAGHDSAGSSAGDDCSLMAYQESYSLGDDSYDPSTLRGIYGSFSFDSCIEEPLEVMDHQSVSSTGESLAGSEKSLVVKASGSDMARAPSNSVCSESDTITCEDAVPTNESNLEDESLPDVESKLLLAITKALSDGLLEPSVEGGNGDLDATRSEETVKDGGLVDSPSERDCVVTLDCSEDGRLNADSFSEEQPWSRPDHSPTLDTESGSCDRLNELLDISDITSTSAITDNEAEAVTISDCPSPEMVRRASGSSKNDCEVDSSSYEALERSSEANSVICGAEEDQQGSQTRTRMDSCDVSGRDSGVVEGEDNLGFDEDAASLGTEAVASISSIEQTALAVICELSFDSECGVIGALSSLEEPMANDDDSSSCGPRDEADASLTTAVKKNHLNVEGRAEVIPATPVAENRDAPEEFKTPTCQVSSLVECRESPGSSTLAPSDGNTMAERFGHSTKSRLRPQGDATETAGVAKHDKPPPQYAFESAELMAVSYEDESSVPVCGEYDSPVKKTSLEPRLPNSV